MSARSSARFIGMLVVIGAAPAVSAAELSLPSNVAAEAAPALSLPVFLDASRLEELQAAWRTRFGGTHFTIAVPAGESDPETTTINEARETLSRGEVVSRQAAAVRERAEELSRRFATDASVDSGGSPAPDPDPAPVALPDAPVTETASIGSDAAVEEPLAQPPTEPQAQIQQVSASVADAPASNAMTPASMLGGPRVEEAAANAEPAPVIEDMATKPRQPAKRTVATPPARRVVQAAPASPGLFGIFSSWGSTEEESAPKSSDPDKDPMMPTELRSFGWNAQP